MLKEAGKFLKDVLFPIFCVACGAEGEWWCADCRGWDIPLIKSCPVCARPTTAGESCQNCRAVSHLDGVTALFNYEEDNPAARLIKNFKYNYAFEIAELWRVLISSAGLAPIVKNSVSIPIPLHPRRERERGFNQAKILADLVAGCCCLPVSVGLGRVRYTAQQAKLSGAERTHNVAGAFAWKDPGPSPERVLLVDDVYTTGATMQECARVLRLAGAKWIWGFALARG